MIDLSLSEAKQLVTFIDNYQDLGGWSGDHNKLDSALQKIRLFIHSSPRFIIIEHGLKRRPTAIRINPSSNPYKLITPIEVTETTFVFEVPPLYIEDEFHWQALDSHSSVTKSE